MARLSCAVWCIWLLTAASAGTAQDGSDVRRCVSALREQTSDRGRLAWHDSLRMHVERLADSGNALDAGLVDIPTLGVVDATTRKHRIRIIGWNVLLSDQTHRYGCFVVWSPTKASEGYAWLERSMDPQQPSWENRTLSDSANWPGALYYAALPQTDRRRSVFLMLGWNGGNAAFNCKLAETWEIEKDMLRFGTPRIRMQGRMVTAIVLNSREDVVVSLRWAPETKRVIMDHIATPPGTAGVEFSGPDMTYDALKWRNKSWALQENVQVIRPRLRSRITFGLWK